MVTKTNQQGTKMAKKYFRNIPNFEYVNRTKDGQFISNYTTVKNLFKEAHIFSRLESITTTATLYKWTNKLERQYNHIHKQAYKIRKEAEKWLWKGGSSTIPFTVKFKKICHTIKYWKARKKQSQGKKSTQNHYIA